MSLYKKSIGAFCALSMLIAGSSFAAPTAANRFKLSLDDYSAPKLQRQIVYLADTAESRTVLVVDKLGLKRSFQLCQLASDPVNGELVSPKCEVKVLSTREYWLPSYVEVLDDLTEQEEYFSLTQYGPIMAELGAVIGAVLGVAEAHNLYGIHRQSEVKYIAKPKGTSLARSVVISLKNYYMNLKHILKTEPLRAPSLFGISTVSIAAAGQLANFIAYGIIGDFFDGHDLTEAEYSELRSLAYKDVFILQNPDQAMLSIIKMDGSENAIARFSTRQVDELLDRAFRILDDIDVEPKTAVEDLIIFY